MTIHRLYVLFFILMVCSNNTLFDQNLNDVQFKNYNNTVFIVCDNLFCKDCLYNLNKVQHIWRNNYKTVLITKAKKDKKTIYGISKFFRKQLHFDEILFIEGERYFGFSTLCIDKYEFRQTPGLIVKIMIPAFR